jgi:hypothetical protein
MVFFCIRAYLVQAHDTNKGILNLPFSADAWLVVQSLWIAVPDMPEDRVTASLMRIRDDADFGESDDIDEDTTNGGGSDDGHDEITGNASMHDQMRTRSYSCVYTDNQEMMARRCVNRRHQYTTAVNVEPCESLLQDSVAEFCTYICTEPYRDGKAGTTIMVYLAGVLGITPDGVSFKRPKNYTSKLPAIVHSARLRLLKATLPRLPHKSLGWGPQLTLGAHVLHTLQHSPNKCGFHI